MEIFAEQFPRACYLAWSQTTITTQPRVWIILDARRRFAIAPPSSARQNRRFFWHSAFPPGNVNAHASSYEKKKGKWWNYESRGEFLIKWPWIIRGRKTRAAFTQQVLLTLNYWTCGKSHTITYVIFTCLIFNHFYYLVSTVDLQRDDHLYGTTNHSFNRRSFL